MSGANMVVQALVDLGVDTVFGYPGGAVLPIYDALYQHPTIQHILVRHEQAATHAAEGYARSTGKPGVVLVTSGPGATNAVTGITDALRSEEHTSELQSLMRISYAVFCLKNKNRLNAHTKRTNHY